MSSLDILKVSDINDDETQDMQRRTPNEDHQKGAEIRVRNKENE